jgi:hypothetical protein
MYKIKQNDDKTCWQIIEQATGYVMGTADKSNDPALRDLYARLRGGMGFRGWTPAFFLNRVDAKFLKTTDNI